MSEFTLPDTVRALRVAEAKLREELALRHAEHQIACVGLPKTADPKKLPEFWDLMVAHRRWLFASEKLLLKIRRNHNARTP